MIYRSILLKYCTLCKEDISFVVDDVLRFNTSSARPISAVATISQHRSACPTGAPQPSTTSSPTATARSTVALRAAPEWEANAALRPAPLPHRPSTGLRGAHPRPRRLSRLEDPRGRQRLGRARHVRLFRPLTMLRAGCS